MNPQTIFDNYESKSIPPTLWRIDEKISGAQREAEHRLTPPNSLIPTTHQQFKEAVQNHLNWANRSKASCFLSLFSDKTAARNWALERLAGLQRTYRFREEELEMVRLEIDGGRLVQHTWVFDARAVTSLLGIEVATFPGEYLVYCNIPTRAVISKSSLAELKTERANESTTKNTDTTLVALVDDLEIAEDAGNVADDEDPGEEDEEEDVESEEEEEVITPTGFDNRQSFLRQRDVTYPTCHGQSIDK